MRFSKTLSVTFLLAGCASFQFGVQGKSKVVPTENKQWRIGYLTRGEVIENLRRKKQADSARAAAAPAGGTLYFEHFFYGDSALRAGGECLFIDVKTDSAAVKSKCESICRASEGPGYMGVRGIDAKIWCDLPDSLPGPFEVELRDARARLETFKIFPDL